VLDLAAKRKANGLPPVALFFDETVNVEGMSQSYIPPEMRRMLSTGRHLGIEILILCQHLGQLNQGWQDQATDLFWFRTSSEERLKKAASRFGISAKQMDAENRALPFQYHYLHLQDEKFI
jgi:hypothetical protein